MMSSGAMAPPQRANIQTRPCARPRSLNGNHSREARLMLGKAPASPAPKRKRKTTRLARFHAAPVSAVKSVQQGMMGAGTRGGPSGGEFGGRGGEREGGGGPRNEGGREVEAEFDVLADLDDADASDVGDGREAAQPGQHLPAHPRGLCSDGWFRGLDGGERHL